MSETPATTAKASYRAFCRTAPDVPVFAQDWYLDGCAAGGAWDVVLVHERGRVIAALPYFFKQRGPFRYVTMPPFVKMLGPYLLPEFRGILRKEHPILQELIAQLPDFAAFKQLFYPTCTNWLPFYWNKFQQTTYYTYRLTGLHDLPALEARLDPNIRNEIRKARRHVHVVHSLAPAVLFQLVKLSFSRQKLPFEYTEEQFRQHDELLARHQARQLFFAVDEAGRVHSAVQLIWDRTTAYYHLAGDDPTLRNSGAGKLLMWEAIRYTSEVLKLPCFDFEGSMLPGIEYVRVRFGAVQTPYFYVWKYQSRWFRLLEQLKGG